MLPTFCHRSTTNQPGNPYIGAKEPYPELEACVATLSTGPVTPGDGIGYTNVSLVMRSCSTSGMLLQPDRPATAVDATMLQQAFGSGGPQVRVCAGGAAAAAPPRACPCPHWNGG